MVSVLPGSHEALVETVCATYGYKSFLLQAKSAKIVVAACEVGGFSFESDVTMALAVKQVLDATSVDMMLVDDCYVQNVVCGR